MSLSGTCAGRVPCKHMRHLKFPDPKPFTVYSTVSKQRPQHASEIRPALAMLRHWEAGMTWLRLLSSASTTCGQVHAWPVQIWHTCAQEAALVLACQGHVQSASRPDSCSL